MLYKTAGGTILQGRLADLKDLDFLLPRVRCNERVLGILKGSMGQA